MYGSLGSRVGMQSLEALHGGAVLHREVRGNIGALRVRKGLQGA